MPTYTVQLDGVLSSTTTEGVIAASMYTQLRSFLLNNSASLGTSLIAEGAGFSFTNQRLAADTGGSSVGGQFGDPGCGAANAGRKGYCFYIWDVTSGGTSGQWCCIRFNSASVPFDVLLHNYSGSRTREGRPTTTWLGDTSDFIGTQLGYRFNTFTAQTSAGTSIDCAPFFPTPGGNDYTLQTRTEEGIPSSFTEGDFTVVPYTGFYYQGSRALSDNRLRGGGLAIQIAQRADGGPAWALGTGSQTGLFIPAGTGLTSASLVTPNSPYQWTSGSSTLGIFPIANSTPGGFYLTSSKTLFPIVPDSGLVRSDWSMRYHLIADPNNLLIVTSDAAVNNTSSYKFCYFGKYQTLKDSNSKYPWTMQVPYVFLATMSGSNLEPTVPVGQSLVDGSFRNYVLWGTWQGNDVIEGGSWYPTASNGTAAIMLDLPNRSRDPNLNPNKLTTPFSYDRYIPGIYLTGTVARSHQGLSYLGQFGELIRAVTGLASHDQSSDLKWAIVGNRLTNITDTGMINNGSAYMRQKMIIPWNGSTLIGTNSTAGGLTGSIST